MEVIDDSGLTDAERELARAALSRDPALGRELELLLPALSVRARSAFWRSFLRRGGDPHRPAAAVLEALVEAAGESEG
jgi:hypothetical protein